jgi:iron(III) transport system permease protein
VASPTDLSSPTAPRAARRRGGAPGTLRAAAAVIAVLFAAPLAYLLVRNVTDGAYWSALAGATTLGPLLRSLLLATLVSAGAAVLGTGAAWLVARTDVPGRRWFRLVLPLPLVIPSFIGAFSLIAAFAPGGLLVRLLSPLGIERLPEVRGLVGATVVLTLLTYPYVYLPVAARLAQLPPSFEEAARLLGRRPRDVFREVVLPQLRPAILAGTLLVFLYVISDFGAVQLLRYDTFAREIYVAWKSFDLASGLALSLNLGLLAVLVVVLERITGRRSLAVSSSRSLRGLQQPLGRWRPAATIALGALVTGAFLAPITVLAYWALRGILASSDRASLLASDPSALLVPMLTTARVSVVAALVAVVAVLPVAYLAIRFRSKVGEAASTVVVAGFALPGIALALALVFWTLRTGVLGGLYQTETLLIFAYVVHFGAQALRAAEVAVTSVPRRLDDAARALGAGRLRRLVSIDLPLMLPGLAAGAGLVLLSTMKELPATLLLAPNGFQTLATRIWADVESAYLADASIASLVLVALSGVLTWSLVIRRSDAL